MPMHAQFQSIIAISYASGDAVDPLLARWTALMAVAGVRMTGLVQQERAADRDARCNMDLTVLPTGARVRISEDRGMGARGCRLDHHQLTHALMLAAEGLDRADILVLNRFGKVEAEGGGGRDLVAAAVMRNVPVVVAVPWRNLAEFRVFTAKMALELPFASLVARNDPLASITALVSQAAGLTKTYTGKGHHDAGHFFRGV